MKKLLCSLLIMGVIGCVGCKTAEDINNDVKESTMQEEMKKSKEELADKENFENAIEKIKDYTEDNQFTKLEVIGDYDNKTIIINCQQDGIAFWLSSIKNSDDEEYKEETRNGFIKQFVDLSATLTDTFGYTVDIHLQNDNNPSQDLVNAKNGELIYSILNE